MTGSARRYAEGAGREGLGPVVPRGHLATGGLHACAWCICRRAGGATVHLCQTNAVRKIATKVAVLKKYGQEKAFVYSDLREYVCILQGWVPSGVARLLLQVSACELQGVLGHLDG